MYQALYRKYRPNNFNDIIGQDIIKKSFINSINNDRISHAYLFQGPRGTGKTSTAKIVAKLVNCVAQIDGVPCEKCPSCLEFNIRQNLDIIEIDAASNNGVDEIRELKSKVNILPSTGKYKIYIVDEVHMLSIGAFNALLKTLEEPPEHVIFILATTELSKIPSTILSRCQRHEFNKISQDSIYKRLRQISENENICITDEAVYEIARSADGGLRDAIGVLDKLSVYTSTEITLSDVHVVNFTVSRDDLKKTFDFIKEYNLEEYVKFVNELDCSGKDLVKFAGDMLEFLKTLLLQNVRERKTESNGLILNYIEEFNLAFNQMKDTYSPKTVLELIIIKLNPNAAPKANGVVKIKKEKLGNKNISQIKTLEDLLRVRVNNALSGADKVLLKSLKDDWKKLSEFLNDSEYSQVVRNLLDGTVTVASMENVVIVFEYETSVNIVNGNLTLVEDLLEKVFGAKYKIISQNKSDWEITKKKYIIDTKENKKYEYIEENVNYSEIFKERESV